MTDQHRFDAIVVGGGHNGLVAAGYLARAGLRVILFERRERVGGLCERVEYFPGFVGSMANSPSALEPKVVRDLELEKFGLTFHRPDPALVTPFPDGRLFAAWREKERVVTELERFSKRDAKAYFEFFDYLQAFATRLKVSLFEPPPTVRDFIMRLQTPEDEEIFGKLFFGSIKDLLDERFETEEIKSVIAAISVVGNLLGPSTPGTPSMLLQRPLSLASLSTTFADDPRRQVMRGSTGLPVGGMGEITVAMRRSFEAYGGIVKTEAEIAAVLVSDGAVHGVALADGTEYSSPIVLSNLNPKTTYLDLIDKDAVAPDFRQRVENIKMTGSAFKAALALDGVPRVRAAKTDEQVRLFGGCQFRIAPSMEYLDRSYEDAKYGRPSTNPVFWGLTPSVTDPSVAPPGKHVMSINIFHAPFHLREGNWSALKDSFGKRCIDLLTEYIPNLKDIIVDTRFWSPEDIARDYGLVEANTTHGDMVPARMFALRPMRELSSYRGPISGLYLCGSGSFPSGQVTGLPGHNASHEVLKDLSSGAAAKRRSDSRS